MRIPICLLALVVCTGLVHAEDPDDQAPASTTAAAPAPAPDAPPATPPAKFGGWVFSGLLDGYITANQNHPASNLNQLQNFDIMWGQPLISMAKFTMDKSDTILGFHVDMGFGETMRLIHAADTAQQEHHPLRGFEQMYGIIKPHHMRGTEIDLGTFVTSAGAEVIESTGNWNYSRSILFAWAIPFYHFGVKVTTPVNKVVTVGAQVVGPWNQTWGDHKFTNVGLTLGVTKGKFVWNSDYYVGPNNPVVPGQPSGGLRQLFDSTVTVNANSKVSFYVNGDYGRNANATGGGSTNWEGIAGAVRVQATKKIAFAGRTEYFNDAQGFETGTTQNLKEGTLTGEYKLNDMFMARVEYRHDNSSVPFFDRGAQTGVVHNMTTMTLGVTATFGPYK